jgi:hypothetical protein
MHMHARMIDHDSWMYDRVLQYVIFILTADACRDDGSWFFDVYCVCVANLLGQISCMSVSFCEVTPIIHTCVLTLTRLLIT